jgi:hypothetical protein
MDSRPCSNHIVRRASRVVVGLLLAASSAVAAPPGVDHAKLAREFLTSSGMAKWYDDDLRYESEALQSEVEQAIPSKNRAQAKKLIVEAMEKIGWRKMENAVVSRVVKDYTVAELQELIRFFRTAAGQKLARVPLERQVRAVTKELVKSPMLQLQREMQKLVPQK